MSGEFKVDDVGVGGLQICCTPTKDQGDCVSSWRNKKDELDKMLANRLRKQEVSETEVTVTPQALQVIANWRSQSKKSRVKHVLVNKENLVEVYTSAKHLGVWDLESHCIRFAKKKLDHNADTADLLNIWDELKIMRRSGSPELVKVIASKLAASFRDTIFQSNRYVQMDPHELFMLLSSDELVIDSEMDVFDATVTWLLHDWPKRNPYITKLLSTVRFGLLTPLQLVQLKLSTPGFNESTEDEQQNNYAQILTTIKPLIDDYWLPYSVFVKWGKLDHLKYWAERTGAKPPRDRKCLKKKKNNNNYNIGKKYVVCLCKSMASQFLKKYHGMVSSGGSKGISVFVGCGGGGGGEKGLDRVELEEEE